MYLCRFVLAVRSSRLAAGIPGTLYLVYDLKPMPTNSPVATRNVVAAAASVLAAAAAAVVAAAAAAAATVLQCYQDAAVPAGVVPSEFAFLVFLLFYTTAASAAAAATVRTTRATRR